MREFLKPRSLSVLATVFYFGKDGERLVILLVGGTKRRQQQDITAAQERWQDYKDRKKGNL